MADYIMQWTDKELKPLPVVVSPAQHTNGRTSLSLVGQGKFSYGDLVQVNFLRLLENFASLDKPPNYPTTGQLWFNAKENLLKVFYDDSWYNVSTYVDDEPPENYAVGNLWYDTEERLLKYWDGFYWIAVGTKIGVEPPLNPNKGQLWFNDSAKQMSYWNGSTWIVLDTDNIQKLIQELNNKVNKDGDKMKGMLSLFEYPKEEMDAANKGYIDNIIQNIQSEVSKGSVVIDSYFVELTKPTKIIGPFPWVYAPNRSTLLVYVQGVKQKLDISYEENSITTISFFEELPAGINVEVIHLRSGVEQFIEVAGDSMEGPLLLSREPESPLEASTKSYVDAVRIQLEQKLEELILNHSPNNLKFSAAKRYYFGSIGH